MNELLKNTKRATWLFCLATNMLLPFLKAQEKNEQFYEISYQTISSKSGDSSNTRLPWWKPATDFHKERFVAAAGAGLVVYTGLSVGLWNIWYSQYPITSFHFFNDAGEWLQVDKAGHTYSAYNIARTSFHTLCWTGLDRKKAAWAAVGTGLGFLSTIEVMDGFSEKWGFSPSDMGANLLGSTLFLSQELLWQEQRIFLKVSSSHPSYSASPLYSESGQGVSSLQQRAEQLYGRSLFERLLKDYNAQTNWLSFNLASLMGSKSPDWLPPWLNLALGYGADNMFGGFDNRWTEEGEIFQTNLIRYRQYYLSFDVDFSRLPANEKPLLRGFYQLLNLFKIPSPTLEYNSLGKIKFHWIFF